MLDFGLSRIVTVTWGSSSAVAGVAVATNLAVVDVPLLPPLVDRSVPFSDGRSLIVACVMDSSSSEVMCSDFIAEREAVGVG